MTRFAGRRLAELHALPFAEPVTITTRAQKVERTIWTYDPSNGSYYEDGRKVSDVRLRSALNQYLEHQRERVRDVTADLASGYKAVAEWEQEMRQIVKQSIGGAYMLGRGGRNAMTPSDWGKVGIQTREQYRFLNGFAKDVAAGEVTAEQAMARASLYVGAAREAHEKATGVSRGWPTLPYYPGDGSTECLGNCGCYWDVEETDDGGYEATWVLTKANNCDDCLERADEYAPLVLSA